MKRYGTALLWIAAALTIAGAYWVCLRYLFPGYFAPLSAFHVDFYEYASFRDKSLAHILHYPRPAAYYCMKLLGWGGLDSVMAGGIAVALGNIWLTAFLARQIAGARSFWFPLAVAVYALLLFAQPDFYFEHRHDLPAEVSYFFAMVSLIAWNAFLKQRGILAGIGLLGVSICAAVLFVFSKETYFVSALCLVLGMALGDWRKWRWHASFLLALAVLEAGSFLWTAHLNGPFINTHASADNSYKIDLAPWTVATTAWFYLSHLFNPFLALTVAWFLYLLRDSGRRLGIAIAFVMAGLAAFIPHAVLPNHVFEEYAWVGAPLILAPVLLWDARQRRWTGAAVMAALVLLTLFAPWGYRDGYRSPELAYEVRQDQIGLPVARSVKMLHGLPPNSRVLVVGLEATYTPFHTESFLLTEFGGRMSWTLLTGPGIAPRRISRVVRTVTFSEVKLDAYDQLVTYDADGFLKSIRPVSSLSGRERGSLYTLLPGLRLAAELTGMYPREAYRKFVAADICLNWGDWDDAQRYIRGAEEDGAEKDATYRRLSERLEAGRRDLGAVPDTATAVATLEARPARLVDTDGSGAGVTELVWNISPPRPCEIHVNAPDGKLFAIASVAGSGKTQKWVRNGMKFFLQDVSDGKPLTAANTLAAVTVEVSAR